MSTTTLKDVAELAGVSRSAVSRTFTKGASVSPRTREKVEAAAKALGYRPNALASSLTTGRTGLIGLVADNFRNPMFLKVFDLFTRGIQDRGLRPLLLNLTDKPDPEEAVALLQSYSVDGVVVASSTLPASFPQAFHDAGVPVVHSFGRAASDPHFDLVGIDNVACGAMAARTLLDRGYRHVGFLGGPEQATSTEDRLKGFLSVVAATDGAHAKVCFASAYAFDAGRVEMTKELMTEPAEAYFCGDDVLSIGALSAVQSAGLRCPDDVGLIGLNDMEMARWENISLTTIAQPLDAIIGASMDAVTDRLISDDLPAQSQVFQCTLMERGTLRPLPAS